MCNNIRQIADSEAITRNIEEYYYNSYSATEH